MREGLLQDGNGGGDKRPDWALPPPVSKQAERPHSMVRATLTLVPPKVRV